MLLPEKNKLSSEWWVIIDHKKKGPYSLKDLSKNPHFTPETLVWKEGFIEWVPARTIPELLELFPKESDLTAGPQLILAMERDPYQKIVWILLLLFTFFYLLYFLKMI